MSKSAEHEHTKLVLILGSAHRVTVTFLWVKEALLFLNRCYYCFRFFQK